MTEVVLFCSWSIFVAAECLLYDVFWRFLSSDLLALDVSETASSCLFCVFLNGRDSASLLRTLPFFYRILSYSVIAILYRLLY